MQMRPMISILMPSYNHERFIAIAIESALKQKTKYSFELLINDDNSTDETAKIAETYSQRYPNIIRFFKQNKNQGLMKSYKFLLNNAKGEYIAILESDDYWIDEEKLEKQIEKKKNNPEFGLSVSDVKLVNENNDEIEVVKRTEDIGLNGNWYEQLLFSNFVRGGVSICFRKAIYDSYVDIDDYINNNFVTFDYPLLLTLAAHSKCNYIHKALSAYRILPTSLSNNAIYEKVIAFEKGILAIQRYIMQNNQNITLRCYSITEILNYRYNILCGKAYKHHKIFDFCRYARNIKPITFKTFILRFFPALWYIQHSIRFK